MNIDLKHIFIISDIEGTSGCWSYEASSFKTEKWSRACVEMSYDMNTLVNALFEAGVKKITIKDFHRTGYNLLPELIDRRARIIQGYSNGRVPGIGDPGDAEALMLIGMHAASGSDGFLAHTLTSDIESLVVNDKLMSEAELFSASLAQFCLRPIFFSGCPVACAQAKDAIKGINTYSIDKSGSELSFDTKSWRLGLAIEAVKSLENETTKPYLPEGPFRAVVKMKDGEKKATKIAQKWGFDRDKNTIYIEASTIHDLYNHLIRLSYLTPTIEKIIWPGLFLYNLWGMSGLAWVRRKIKNK